MPSLADLTAQLGAGRDLEPAQAEAAAAALAAPDVPDQPKADFLTALARKGETAAEVAAFATAFRARAVDPGVGAWAGQAIDVVGTGGDHAGGFNISTLVVLVLASSGVPVMKHGNRGITSRCGSADLFAELGVNLEASPEQQRAALAELGFAFFFAPAYHPAFRHIGPVRKALAAQGQRTIFNILGPVLNPGRPAHSLVGVFAAAWVERLAGALTLLGSKAGIVGHGVLGPDRGIDELTTATANRVKGLGRLAAVDGTWNAADFGLPACDFAELKGGDLPANRVIIDSLLAGRGPAGLADTIALNAAVALWICGRTKTPAEGVAAAKEALVGGAVRRKIAATREFFRS